MFIWGNSSQKIKHETLYMDYKNDALNICLKFVILHCSWAKWRFDDFFLWMMNCFCRTVDRRIESSFISSRDHCQSFSPSRISDTMRAGFETTQNLSSGFVEWTCAVVMITTLRRHYTKSRNIWQKSLFCNRVIFHWNANFKNPDLK